MKLNKQDIPFTMVANEVLTRTDISLKAKGLFAYLFSKPEGWDFAADRIARECKEERKAVLATLKELETLGLLSRQKMPDGRVDYTIRYATQSPKSGLRLFDEPKSQNGTVPKRHGAETGSISNKDSDSKKEREVIQREKTPGESAKEFFENPEERMRMAEVFVSTGKISMEAMQIQMGKFLLYWQESNKSGTKQRWEMEKVFEVKRRLVTWLSRSREMRGGIPSSRAGLTTIA